MFADPQQQVFHGETDADAVALFQTDPFQKFLDLIGKHIHRGAVQNIHFSGSLKTFHTPIILFCAFI